MVDRWNAAHKAFIDSRANEKRKLTIIDNEIAEVQRVVAEKRTIRDGIVRKIEEIDAVIATSDWEAPDGYGKWGDKVDA